MLKINTDVNLESKRMDISPPLRMINPSDTTEKKTEKEENTTLLSSSMEQESLQMSRKRKLNEINDLMNQQGDEDKLQSIYGNMSDVDIKERLFKTMTNDVHLRNNIKQWLESDITLLPFVRQHASLLAQYSSLKMELDLYQSYINMTDSVLDWLSGMSKTLIGRNNMDDQFFEIQTYIDKQRKKTEDQFRNIEEKLAKSLHCQQQGTASSQIDVRLVTSFILVFVRQDQQQFNVEFIKKRHLLMLNAKDVRLVHEFYHLQPSIRQLYLAERIWDATADQQRTKTNIENNQRHKLTALDYQQIIDDHKRSFPASNRHDEERENSLPMNYAKLNIDLLMNIIESRQKVLLQRLEFHADFKETFPIDDNVIDFDDCDEQEDDHDKNY